MKTILIILTLGVVSCSTIQTTTKITHTCSLEFAIRVTENAGFPRSEYECAYRINGGDWIEATYPTVIPFPAQSGDKARCEFRRKSNKVPIQAEIISYTSARNEGKPFIIRKADPREFDAVYVIAEAIAE